MTFTGDLIPCGSKEWCIGYKHILYPPEALIMVRDIIDRTKIVHCCPDCFLHYTKSRGSIECRTCHVWQNPGVFRYFADTKEMICNSCYSLLNFY